MKLSFPKKRPKRQPLDSFTRIPPRRYDRLPGLQEDLPPSEPIPGFRKRYFDLPDLRIRSPHVLPTSACMLAVLLFCTGSAPLRSVPDVQARFSDWARRENSMTVQSLPGIVPDTTASAPSLLSTPLPEVSSSVAPVSVAPTHTPSPFKHYAPGELTYQNDEISVSIEQKNKDDITYFVCDIRLSDVSQLRTVFANGDFDSSFSGETVSDMADRYAPVLAINADYCRYHHDGVIIRNGELFRSQNIRKHHLLIIDENGDMSVLTDRSGKQGLVAKELEANNTWQTFEFGPVLVEDGKACRLPSSFYVNCGAGYDEPRTAIGQIGPLHYIIIVVDGRRTGYSAGADIPQLQQLFLDEGAQFAFNLDGGGSTTLYFLGEVINMPSGGKERSVSDAILFMPHAQ